MFRVRWNRAARDALTTLWLAADSAGRAELTQTTNRIDGLLSAAGPTAGESRAKGRRILFVGRFYVIYRMTRDGGTASIIQLSELRKP